MGLFTPKWMSDDQSKALKAVEKITDPRKLAEVAVNADVEPGHREEAIRLEGGRHSENHRRHRGHAGLHRGRRRVLLPRPGRAGGRGAAGRRPLPDRLRNQRPPGGRLVSGAPGERAQRPGQAEGVTDEQIKQTCRAIIENITFDERLVEEARKFLQL